MSVETVDVLAVGSHPDDVELCCGGTVARLVQSGRRVGIVHLTGGEAGTRGTAGERRAEAEAAAEALGVATLDQLDCGDGGLRGGAAEEDALIALFRRRRPELVLGPPPSDRHPDHHRAHRLVEAVCFYAGLAVRGDAADGAPHRPAAMFWYMQNDSFEPDFVVDVTAGWKRKMAALDCYASQIHRPGAAGDAAAGPPTKVSSPEFRLAIEGRARHFGALVGAAYGEPFGSRLPLAVADPMTLLPGGIR